MESYVGDHLEWIKTEKVPKDAVKTRAVRSYFKWGIENKFRKVKFSKE